MGLRDKLKKAKGKLIMAIGAGVLATGGGFAFRDYTKGYDPNVTRWNEDFDRVAFVGDSGKPGKILDQTVGMIDRLAPRFVVGAGDFWYDNGIRKKGEFLEAIRRPFYRPGVDFLGVGGNHDTPEYSLAERSVLLDIGRSGEFPWFHYRNYWALHIFPNACLLMVDSAVFDMAYEKKLAKEVIDEQVAFVARATQEKDCPPSKARFYVAHHPQYSPGKSHGDRRPDRYTAMLDLHVRGWAHFMVFGHEHVTAVERCVDQYGRIDADGPWLGGPYAYGVPGEEDQPIYSCHVIVGATSKYNTCTRNEFDDDRDYQAIGQVCIDDRPGVGWFEAQQFDVVLPFGKLRDR